MGLTGAQFYLTYLFCGAYESFNGKRLKKTIEMVITSALRSTTVYER